MKLPIKTGVLKRAMELNELFTAEELSKDLQAEYPGEKTAQVKNVEKIIRTYCGVRIMKAVFFELEPDGELKLTYEVTDFGKSCRKMIP